MKLSAATILLSPGYGFDDDNHWISRWSRQMTGAQFVEHGDYLSAKRDDWVGDLVHVAEKSEKPVVLVGHSLGAIAIIHAAKFFQPGKIAGAFLVTPVDIEVPNVIPGLANHDFGPIPRETLPFDSVVVGSRNDKYCSYAASESFASSWGSTLLDAGNAGHLNIESGQGPWPEGLTAFALFMKSLDA